MKLLRQISPCHLGGEFAQTVDGAYDESFRRDGDAYGKEDDGRHGTGGDREDAPDQAVGNGILLVTDLQGADHCSAGRILELAFDHPQVVGNRRKRPLGHQFVSFIVKTGEGNIMIFHHIVHQLIKRHEIEGGEMLCACPASKVGNGSRFGLQGKAKGLGVLRGNEDAQSPEEHDHHEYAEKNETCPYREDRRALYRHKCSTL